MIPCIPHRAISSADGWGFEILEQRVRGHKLVIISSSTPYNWTSCCCCSAHRPLTPATHQLKALLKAGANLCFGLSFHCNHESPVNNKMPANVSLLKLSEHSWATVCQSQSCFTIFSRLTSVAAARLTPDGFRYKYVADNYTSSVASRSHSAARNGWNTSTTLEL